MNNIDTLNFLKHLAIVPALEGWCKGYGFTKWFKQKDTVYAVCGLFSENIKKDDRRAVAIQYDGTYTTVDFSMTVRFSENGDVLGNYVLKAGKKVKYERQGYPNIEENNKVFLINPNDNDQISNADLEKDVNKISGAFHLTIHRLKGKISTNQPRPCFAFNAEIDSSFSPPVRTVDIELGGPSSQILKNVDVTIDHQYHPIKILLIPIIIDNEKTFRDICIDPIIL